MSTMYLVHLQGGGDTEIFLVDDEGWAFIKECKPFSEETLEAMLEGEREAIKKRGFYDEKQNEESIKELQEAYEDLLTPSGSSPDNDRALFMYSFSKQDFDTLLEYTQYLREHPEVEIKSTFEGYIY